MCEKCDSRSESLAVIHDAIKRFDELLTAADSFDVPPDMRSVLFLAVVDARVRSSVGGPVLDWAVSVIDSLGLEPIEVDRLKRSFGLMPGERHSANSKPMVMEIKK